MGTCGPSNSNTEINEETKMHEKKNLRVHSFICNQVLSAKYLVSLWFNLTLGLQFVIKRQQLPSTVDSANDSLSLQDVSCGEWSCAGQLQGVRLESL